MNLKNDIDFEQGDVVLVEDKISETLEECVVVSEDNGVWKMRTQLGATIKYEPRKAATFKIYRYQVIGLKNE